MTRLVLEIIAPDDSGTGQFIKLSHNKVSIGRAPSNDVIINDPYVSARHLLCSVVDGGWQVEDLGSDNGSFLGEERLNVATPHAFITGHTLTIGQTKIIRHDLASTVAPTLILEKKSRLISFIDSNAWIISLVFISMLAINLGTFYAFRWNDEAGKFLSAVAAISSALVLGWSVPWSLAGRLLRGRAQFFLHIFFACVFLICAAFQTILQGYVDYVLSDNIFAKSFDVFSNFILMTFIIYMSLLLSSRMPRQKSLSTAAFFSAGVLAIIMIMVTISQRDFEQNPEPPSTMQAWPSGLLPSQDIDSFLKKSSARVEKIK